MVIKRFKFGLDNRATSIWHHPIKPILWVIKNKVLIRGKKEELKSLHR